MAKTGDFKELVRGRVNTDKKFAEALLREGIAAMRCGDFGAGEIILRDYMRVYYATHRLIRDIN